MNPAYEDAKKIFVLRHNNLNHSTYLLITKQGQLLFFPNMASFHFKDIISVELIIDEENYASLGSTFAGGLLMGGPGALIGSMIGRKRRVFSMAINFSINNFVEPLVSLKFIVKKTNTRSKAFKDVQERMQTLIATLKVLDSEYNDVKLFG
jgi:hypothetical protein